MRLLISMHHGRNRLGNPAFSTALIGLAAIVLFSGIAAFGHSPAPAGRSVDSPAIASPCGLAATACLSPQVQPSATSPQNLSWVHLRHPSLALPAARTGAALASDPVDGGTLLFGGCGPSQCPMNDTWWYSGGLWTNLTSTLASSPPARYGGSAAFDPSSGSVVLFGGCTASGVASDAWLFHDGAWAPVTAATPWPAARCGGTATSDPAADGAAFYGGGDPTGSPLSDLWIYSNGTFSELAGSASSGPGYRSGASLTYDGSNHALLVYGGRSPSGGFRSDGWFFVQGQWVPATTAGLSPPGRSNASFAYDPTLSGDLLFGGTSNAGILGDTWLYSGGSWADVSTRISHPPAPHTGAATAYDDADGYLLLEGGTTPTGGVRNDTWALVPPLAAGVVLPYGGIQPNEAVRLAASVTGGVPPYHYNWSFGDGTPALHLPAPVHSFSQPGSYTIRVTVTDFRNVVAWSNLTVFVSNAPVSVLLSVTPSLAGAGTLVSIVATVTGGAAPFTVHWSGLPVGCASGTQTSVSCRPTTLGAYAIGVAVTDSFGHTASAGATLTVAAIAPTFASAPSTSAGGVFARYGWILVPPLGAAVAWSAYASLLSYRATRNLPPLPPPPTRPECYVPPEWSETPADFPEGGTATPAPPHP